jgi:hypothetical protein
MRRDWLNRLVGVIARRANALLIQAQMGVGVDQARCNHAPPRLDYSRAIRHLHIAPDCHHLSVIDQHHPIGNIRPACRDNSPASNRNHGLSFLSHRGACTSATHPNGVAPL